ncbi:MAG TPA: hypothetical protein VGR31_03750 [Planctomycetota bacterium]|nr:hypothetical protein [Planctomycetota bacterium]
MKAESKIINCLPPREGELVGPSFRLTWWAWLSLAAAIAIELILG